MDSISFKHVPVRVGMGLNSLKYLVATSVDVNTTNSINQVKSLGYYNSYPLQFPSNFVTNNISIQYAMQSGDPIKPIIDNIKTTQNNDASGFYLDVGGLTFSGMYLENFSFSINPNTPVSAQATFVSYSPVTGQFGRDSDQSDDRINGIISANFLYGHKANVSISTAQEDLSNYFGLSYNFKADYLPVNTIGSNYPKVIKLNGAQEDLEITENLYRRVYYTGDTRSITLNISGLCYNTSQYSLSIDRAQSVSSNMNSQNNGVVTALRKFTKYY
jgi:hypothetical protein